MRFVFLLCVAPLWAAPCEAVEGASILARDVARVVPAFAKADPSAALVRAPIAGVQRIVTEPEMAVWARKLSIDPSLARTEACFERAAAPLTADELLPALQSVFPTAKIEIVEFEKIRAPKGKLEFTRGGLEPSGLWRGRIIYDTGRSLPVTARVRVTEERSWIEAKEVLPVGKPITEDQLAVVTGPRSLLNPLPIASLEDAIGKKPTRIIGPGAPLFSSTLMTPPQVAKGDKVLVQVSEGGAFLEFEAEAENPGHIGDMVFLRNPESGRRFQAKVEAKGKVAIRK